jgi:excisionase family DNA binding protein
MDNRQIELNAPRRLKPREAMARLNCGVTHFYRLVKENRIELLKDGRSSWVRPEVIDEYIASLPRAIAIKREVA